MTATDLHDTPTPPQTNGSSAYSPHEHRPLGTYAGFTGVFGAALAGSLLALQRSGHTLPERPAAGDVVLIGLTTHKLSRMITKDKATSFLRAPFTRYQAPAGHGELDEQPRGSGLRLVLGELLVCPYCLAQWVAAGLTVGMVAAPRHTRFVGAIYSSLTLADFLQLAYHAGEQQA